MKLRARFDIFSAALLTALGASQIAACGGSASGTGNEDAGASGSSGNTGNRFPCKNPVGSSTGEISSPSLVPMAERPSVQGRSPSRAVSPSSEHATDPRVHALLLTISDDETRHAELAFRFLKWAICEGDAALNAAVHGALEVLQREAESRPIALDAVECELLQNGVVPRSMSEAIRARAIAEVVLPCARALLTSRQSATRPRRAIAGMAFA